MTSKEGPILYTGTIMGTPITKKNSNRIITGRHGQPVIIPSAQFERYQEAALKQLKRIDKPIHQPCNVMVEYHVPNLIRRDLVNLLAATCDILVAAGILEDDNWRIAYSHDGSKVVVDRCNPYAYIHITARPDVLPWWDRPKPKPQPKGTTIWGPPPPKAE